MLRAVRRLRGAAGRPLIGFAGAPFTLASYLVEGGPSQRLRADQGADVVDPAVWDRLMSLLADRCRVPLGRRSTRGWQAVQLFDSWVGALTGRTTGRRAAVLARDPSGRSRMGCRGSTSGSGTGDLLEAMRDAGGRVVGVDWRTPLDRALEACSATAWPSRGTSTPPRCWPRRTRCGAACSRVLDAAGGRPGHMFNLGHGVLPPTDHPRSGRSSTSCTSRPNGGPRDVADRAAGDGVRDGVRTRRHRALLHGHPRRPHADARAPGGAPERYAAIGNRFPLLEITTRQAEGMAGVLNEEAGERRFGRTWA